MQFTDEERKIIDRLLTECEEMQRQNGNKTYTHEEVWNYFWAKFENDMKKARKNKIYNIKTYFIQKGEKHYKYLSNKIYG